MCIHATTAQIGSELQKSLKIRIVDESGVNGTFSDSLPIDPTDSAAANKALAAPRPATGCRTASCRTYAITRLPWQTSCAVSFSTSPNVTNETLSTLYRILRPNFIPH